MKKKLKCPYGRPHLVPNGCKHCPTYEPQQGCLKAKIPWKRHHRMPDGKLVEVKP